METKLLILTDTYVGGPGGSERHLYNLLSNLSHNISATVIQMCPSHKKSDITVGQLPTNPNVILQHKPVDKVVSIAFFQLSFRVIKHVKEENIAFIISYHEKSDILNALIKKQSGSTRFCISSKRDLGFALSPRMKWLMRKVSGSFDGFLAPSISIGEMLYQYYGVPTEKLWVIPNGTDLAKFCIPTKSTKNTIKGELGIPSTANVVGSVGSLKSVKGYQYLIEGFSMISPKLIKGWYLVLVGDGELYCDLIAQAEKCGISDRVIFVGVRDDIERVLKAFDIFINCSLSEGLSNALIEAAATGLPLVATDVGGNSEIVKNHYNGILIQPESPEAICSSLTTLFQDSAILAEYGENSRSFAETSYSNDSMVSSIERILHRPSNGVKNA